MNIVQLSYEYCVKSSCNEDEESVIKEFQRASDKFRHFRALLLCSMLTM